MKQQGFTLIELMVVLVIIGIASAAISLTIKPDPLHLLRKDAERLSQLLQVAQAEARADGRPITWRADAKGFRFNRRSDDGLGVESVPGRRPAAPAPVGEHADAGHDRAPANFGARRRMDQPARAGGTVRRATPP